MNKMIEKNKCFKCGCDIWIIPNGKKQRCNNCFIVDSNNKVKEMV